LVTGAVLRYGAAPRHGLLPTQERRHFGELLPDILDGRIEPRRVFDRVVELEGVPDGYRAMNERDSIKVMVEP
jgi:threonine dehydrogenase-like Zn-dependent dehydrogenase